MVDQTLSLHDGAITKFSLKRCCIKSNSSVSRWLSYLSGHGINSLELSVYRKNQNTVPLSLKGFDHLQHLYLGYTCQVKIPPSSKEFNKLVKLELIYSILKLGDGAVRNWDDSSIMKYLKAQHSSNVCLSRLENVKLRWMMGFPSELEFVKILLRWASALKKLEIYTRWACDNTRIIQMIRELEHIKCSMSSKVEFIFNTP
ncbi:uncharacterized protein LOC127264495 [Andrographis paniculata]|uniref:uncharacterized protein LOC127264495 n=1 Tax=Andrographis paniculata TaxID=175694 RepID=UPI0021E8BCA7|nr:uncharacterized protein LOC127264495 [Andrographis paniculata]